MLQTLYTHVDRERLVHSLKTTFACVLGFVITKLAKFPVDQWLLVTIVVIMCAQINVGSVFQKAYARFLGTIMGSLIAAVTLFLFGADHLVLAIAIAVSAMFFSYVATGPSSISDAGTLGATTAVVILVAKEPTLYTAATRFVEISIGILIATLVSQFILPIHARSNLQRNQARLIKQLRDYYTTILMTEPNTISELATLELDEKIVTSLNAQRTLATQASRETLGQFNTALFRRLLWSEKEILRCIGFMRYLHLLSPDSKALLEQHIHMHTFHVSIRNLLTDIAQWMDSSSLTQVTIVLPDLKQLKEVVTLAVQKLSVEDDMHLCAFLFFAQTLVQRLQELMLLVKELRMPPSLNLSRNVPD